MVLIADLIAPACLRRTEPFEHWFYIHEWAPLIIFFGTYLGIVRNKKIPHVARYHIMMVSGSGAQHGQRGQRWRDGQQSTLLDQRTNEGLTAVGLLSCTSQTFGSPQCTVPRRLSATMLQSACRKASFACYEASQTCAVAAVIVAAASHMRLPGLGLWQSCAALPPATIFRVSCWTSLP